MSIYAGPIQTGDFFEPQNPFPRQENEELRITRVEDGRVFFTRTGMAGENWQPESQFRSYYKRTT